jgi:hypothetical protein
VALVPKAVAALAGGEGAVAFQSGAGEQALLLD